MVSAMTVLSNTLFRCLLAIAIVFGCTLSAAAHSPDQSYIYLDVTDTTLTGRYEAGFKDLDAVLGIDADEDGTVTEEEMRAADAAITAYLVDNLLMEAGGTDLIITPTETTYATKNGIDYAKVFFEVTGFETTPERINTTFSGMWETFGDEHEVFGLIGSNTRTGLEENEANINVIFSPETQTQDVSLSPLPWTELLWYMVVQGVWHIWLGFDHVLFLCTLLIPAVMVVVNNRWEASETLHQPLWTVLKMVTAFTLAHSITLSIAALGLISLPAWLVESIIALSIAYVALTILIPRLHKNMFWVVVIFGLFHGFGFAFVLEPINIEPNQKLLTLAGFNIGVELGQIAIVLAVFPVLYLLRNSMFYNWGVMKAGSLALIAISLIWFEERAFDLMGPILPTVRNFIGV